MVKMPKNKNDQKDKFKRPFFSECSGKVYLRHYYYKGFRELQREREIDKVQKGRTKITYRTSSRKEENTHTLEREQDGCDQDRK